MLTMTSKIAGRMLLTATLAVSSAPSHAQDIQALRAELAGADQALFNNVFNTCDAEAVGAMVTDDFEFFHDKWGQIAKSRTDFVASIRSACARQKAGSDFKARREVLQASVVVFPMENYGALQMGVHRFFRLEPGKPDIPTEHAKFAHLWRRDGGRWLLARVISYEHIDEVNSQTSK